MFDHLMQITGLGILKKPPQTVSGGLMHTMWRLETDQGVFAVKELNKSILMTEEKQNEFEQSENIARNFQLQSIPAISAVLFAGKSLVSSPEGTFIFYPWVEAINSEQISITKNHIQRMASIFAAMHRLNMQSEDMAKPSFEPIAQERLFDFKEMPFLNEWNEKLGQTYPALQKDLVISHGDLDKKNVLWREEDPILIDWECVRYLNPTQEIINAAFDWSGLFFDETKTDLFAYMIENYKKAGGVIDQEAILPALYGIARNWTDWLLYNYTRTDKPDIAKTEVEKTSKILMFLHENMDGLVNQIKCS